MKASWKARKAETKMPKYDFLIVGAGLFGATFARQAADRGKKCLVIDRRPQLGGNLYCEDIEDITVHAYGAHIFHTGSERVWRYVNRFVTFNGYVHEPVALYKGAIYNLPFNMNTFARMWGVTTPEEARARIASQRAEIVGEPQNLEEQAISLVGRDIYEALVKGYSEKQWGRDCRDLPASIIRRLPVRYTYDNRYFFDRYQGVPEGGYNPLIDALLSGSEARVNTDFVSDRKTFEGIADTILFTGRIDEFYEGRLGPLCYRSLRFEHETPETDKFQGAAVVNYTERDVPYTRIIEHKHFAFGNQPGTVITREYPLEWKPGLEPYYPIGDEVNRTRYSGYEALARREERVLFGGRLGLYRYMDMDTTILAALELADRVLPS